MNHTIPGGSTPWALAPSRSPHLACPIEYRRSVAEVLIKLLATTITTLFVAGHLTSLRRVQNPLEQVLYIVRVFFTPTAPLVSLFGVPIRCLLSNDGELWRYRVSRALDLHVAIPDEN